MFNIFDMIKLLGALFLVALVFITALNVAEYFICRIIMMVLDRIERGSNSNA